MTLPPGFLDDLRSRVPLARIVARKVTWDPRKSKVSRGDYWAPCPFHQEKTASFHVDDGKGFYYCFGCHAKGDAIDFLRESEGMGFMEAVEALAAEAGMPLPERTPGAAAAQDRRSRLHAAMEAAAGFYRLQLSTARAAEARTYLDRRGLAAATRDRFEIGWAPRGGKVLLGHLAGKGFSPEEIAEAGLGARPKDGGEAMDYFRGRIVFPIRDARGRAIAFGGRSLDPEARAKYLNSPETPLFDKGRTLFNVGPARAAAGRGARLLVAEGYMDVVALVQAGFEAAVAALGTAITEDQLEGLWRLAPEPLVALDGDRAGLRAAQRLVDLALPRLVAGRSLRFVLMPPGQDPDDVLRDGGRAAMEALLERSEPIVELLWRRETDGQPLDSPERRAALDARLRAHLGRIRDESLRTHTAAAFRERRARSFGPPAPPSSRRGRDGRREPPGGRRWGGQRQGEPTAGSRASLLGRSGEPALAEARIRESAILFALVNHPELVPAFEDRLDRLTFRCPDLAEIRDSLLLCAGESLPEPADAGAGGARSLQTREIGGAGVHESPHPDLADRLSRRLGFDPQERLGALGQIRANPHLGRGATSAQAALAIEEEIATHAARLDRVSEIRDAVEAIALQPDEGLTWRLRQLSDSPAPPADGLAEGDPDGDRARWLQDMIDREVWKKPRGPR